MQTQSDDLTGEYMAERNDSVVSPYDELMGEERQQVSPLKKVFRFFSDVGQGAFIESPRQIIGGVYDAAKNAGQAVESILDFFQGNIARCGEIDEAAIPFVMAEISAIAFVHDVIPRRLDRDILSVQV